MHSCLLRVPRLSKNGTASWRLPIHLSDADPSALPPALCLHHQWERGPCRVDVAERESAGIDLSQGWNVVVCLVQKPRRASPKTAPPAQGPGSRKLELLFRIWGDLAAGRLLPHPPNMRSCPWCRFIAGPRLRASGCATPGAAG